MNQENKSNPKHVLLIDSSPLFEGFLKEKLAAEKIKVTLTKGDRDAFQKMVSQLPDLIIIDIESDFDTIQNFLESKLHERNAVRIPTIISGPEIPKEQIANLIKFGVVKYYAKPIKFDSFFRSIGNVLHMTLTIDETACMLGTHINGNLIFIEVAQGLNRDKLSLLKYRLCEILDRNTFHEPKLIVMMSNLELTFVDGANLELLFDTLVDEKRIKRTNIKVLAKNEFIKELIAGHSMYNGIEISEKLSDILANYIDVETTEDLTDMITEKILDTGDEAVDSDVELRFDSDTGNEDQFDGSKFNIAIVDATPASQQAISAEFAKVNIKTAVFGNGQSLIQAVKTQKFDLIILDLYLPDVNGFQLLNYFKQQNFQTPILVHSMTPSKQFVVQALQFGAKGFIGKPQKPEVVLQKSIEIIKNTAI